jgi:putative N-acetylmannosamine-6-phosphate epimerase
MTAHGCQEGSFMGVVYSMYDALVSINVPTEKAKAVIDAMEREMMDKVATKSDVENLRLATKADFDHVREVLSKDIVALQVATEADFLHFREVISKDFEVVNGRIDHLTHVLTVRLFGAAAVVIAALAAVQKLF